MWCLFIFIFLDKIGKCCKSTIGLTVEVMVNQQDPIYQTEMWRLHRGVERNIEREREWMSARRMKQARARFNWAWVYSCMYYIEYHGANLSLMLEVTQRLCLSYCSVACKIAVYYISMNVFVLICMYIIHVWVDVCNGFSVEAF